MTSTLPRLLIHFATTALAAQHMPEAMASTLLCQVPPRCSGSSTSTSPGQRGGGRQPLQTGDALAEEDTQPKISAHTGIVYTRAETRPAAPGLERPHEQADHAGGLKDPEERGPQQLRRDEADGAG